MRFLIPSKKIRKEIDGILRDYFTDPDSVSLDEPVRRICEFYHLTAPDVAVVSKIKGSRRGKTLGVIYEYQKGKSLIYEIKLIKPSVWEFSEDEWVDTFYHELGHYVFWADAEAKADNFARKIQEGL